MNAYKEWDEPVVPVPSDCLPELVSPEAQFLIALNVAELYQSNQTSLLHTGVGLQGEIGLSQ